MPNRAPLLLALLCASFAARAQSLPPPPSLLPPPPPALLPPPPPAWTPTADLIAQTNALEAVGRHKKRVGIALIASGGALVLAGSGLVIAGGWHGDHSCYDGNYYGGYGYRSYDYGCGDDALTIAGVSTALLGGAALVPGIVEYIGGGDVIRRARLLRQCGGFCW